MTDLANYKKYWKNLKPFINKDTNTADKYTNNNLNNRCEYLLSKLNKIDINKKSPIIELGCNAGRNLNYLMEQGYTNLSGYDINGHSFNYTKLKYQKLDKILKKYIGTLEYILPKINKKFDLVYTMAFIMHLDNKEKNILYKWLKNHCKYLICIESFYRNKEQTIQQGLYNPSHNLEKDLINYFKPLFKSHVHKKYFPRNDFGIIILENINL